MCYLLVLYGLGCTHLVLERLSVCLVDAVVCEPLAKLLINQDDNEHIPARRQPSCIGGQIWACDGLLRVERLELRMETLKEAAQWILATQFASLALMPLTLAALPCLRSWGYGMAKIATLIASAGVLWLAATFAGSESVTPVFAMCFATSLIILLGSLSRRAKIDWRPIVVTETLFVFTILNNRWIIVCFIRL